MAKNKFDIKAFALSAGILWGAACLLLGWLAMTGYAQAWVDLLSTTYIGYSASFVGGIIGAIYGFIDAGIGGAVFAWLYNKLL